MSQVAAEVKTEQPSFWTNLMTRRVPQILGTYFALSIGVFQIVQWAVKRLGISPHWETITLTTLLLLIPTVAILAYNHGRRGEKGFMTVEKLGVPINLIAIAALLFTGFKGKDLGNVTETLSLTDENGNKVERVVAKEGFKKRVGLFYLKPDGLSEEDSWLSLAVPFGLQTDLAQNSFIAESNINWRYQFDKAGIKDYLNVPIPLLRRISEDFNYDHFISGKISEANGIQKVTLQLHETESAKIILDQEFENENIFSLIDELSQSIISALEIPTQLIENSKDVPVSDLLTDSPEAFQSLVEGYKIDVFENDQSGALEKSRQAVEIDPTFAYGHIFSFQYADQTGEGSSAAEHLQAASTHSYRLTEEDQYIVNAVQALFSQDFERCESILNELVAIYPGSAAGWRLIANAKRLAGDVDGQIEAFEKWTEADPGAINNYLQIAGLKSSKGDFDGALASAEKYVEFNAKDADGWSTIGKIQRNQKKWAESEESFKKTLLVDPNYRSAYSDLGFLYFRQGQYEKSKESYMKLVDEGLNEQQKSPAYSGLATLARRHGKYVEASEWVDKMLAAYKSYYNPITVTEYTLSSMETYIEAGRLEDVDRMVSDAERHFDNDEVEEFYKFYPAWARMLRALSQENVEEAEIQMAKADEVLSKYSFKSIQDMFLPGRSEVARLNGDFDTSIAHLDEMIKIRPNSYTFWRMKAEVQLEKGDLESALASIQEAVEDDGNSPMYQLILAQVEKKRGNVSESKQALSKALETWKDADTEYKRYKEALELQEELEKSS